MTMTYHRPKCHRPSTGLRASGFREGYEYGSKYACRELWPYLTVDGRKLAKSLVAEGCAE